MSSEIYPDTPGKRLTTSWTTHKLSRQGAHHRIVDSLLALIRNRETLPLTPEYVTVGEGKTPTFHSKTLRDLASF